MHDVLLTLTDGLVQIVAGGTLGYWLGRLFALWLRKKIQRGSD